MSAKKLAENSLPLPSRRLGPKFYVSSKPRPLFEIGQSATRVTKISDFGLATGCFLCLFFHLRATHSSVIFAFSRREHLPLPLPSGPIVSLWRDLLPNLLPKPGPTTFRNALLSYRSTTICSINCWFSLVSALRRSHMVVGQF